MQEPPSISETILKIKDIAEASNTIFEIDLTSLPHVSPNADSGADELGIT
jgi:hypothetical protein